METDHRVRRNFASQFSSGGDEQQEGEGTGNAQLPPRIEWEEILCHVRCLESGRMGAEFVRRRRRCETERQRTVKLCGGGKNVRRQFCAV